MQTWHLAELSWVDVRKYLAKSDTIIVPVGSIENNRPHLPLATDGIAALGVAEALAQKTQTLVAPVVPWGLSAVLMGFPGTITLRYHLVAETVKDICLSLGQHGFRRFLLVSPHRLNMGPIDGIGYEFRDAGLLVVQVAVWRLVRRLCADLAEAEPADLPIAHGSELVTSLILAVRPNLVDMGRAVREIPKPIFHRKYDADSTFVSTFANSVDFTESGLTGDPRRATAEKGRAIIERCTRYLAQLLADMKAAELPTSSRESAHGMKGEGCRSRRPFHLLPGTRG